MGCLLWCFYSGCLTPSFHGMVLTNAQQEETTGQVEHAEGSITFTTNTKLTSDLNVSNDIIIQTGVTLSTDGYSLEAGNALIMQGTANILTGSANNGGTSGKYGIGGNGGSVFTGCSGTTCTSFGSSGGGGGAGYYICSPGSISVCQGNGGFGGNTIKQGGLGGLYTDTTDCDNGNLATVG